MRVDEMGSQLSQMHDSFEIAVARLEKARDEAVKNVDMLQDEVADRDERAEHKIIINTCEASVFRDAGSY